MQMFLEADLSLGQRNVQHIAEDPVYRQGSGQRHRYAKEPCVPTGGAHGEARKEGEARGKSEHGHQKESEDKRHQHENDLTRLGQKELSFLTTIGSQGFHDGDDPKND